MRWLLSQARGSSFVCGVQPADARASSVAGGAGERKAEAHGGIVVERQPDGAEILDPRVNDEPLASLSDFARGPRLVRRKLQGAAAGPQSGFEHGHGEAERAVEWQRVFVTAKPQADFAGRQGGDVNFRCVGHARLLSRDEFPARVNKEARPVQRDSSLVRVARPADARGPFETPPVKGARDLSRQAAARRADPARAEAERKAREDAARALGRAIAITDRRGRP